MPRKNCLDGTSRNEINEKNAAADDPSKCSYRRNPHWEAGNLGHAWITDVIQQHLCHFINTFQSARAKPLDFMGSYLLINRAVRHSVNPW